MSSYISPEQRVPANHPLRKLRPLVDTVLKRLSPRFTARYNRVGGPGYGVTRFAEAIRRVRSCYRVPG
jgi:hypothetical protein